MPITRGMFPDIELLDYDKGLYTNHRFNEEDARIREKYGLFAQGFISKKDLSSVLRTLAVRPKEVLIISSSQVLAESPILDYVLYLPLSDPSESLTPRDPLEDYGCPSAASLSSPSSSKCTESSYRDSPRFGHPMGHLGSETGKRY